MQKTDCSIFLSTVNSQVDQMKTTLANQLAIKKFIKGACTQTTTNEQLISSLSGIRSLVISTLQVDLSRDVKTTIGNFIQEIKNTPAPRLPTVIVESNKDFPKPVTTSSNEIKNNSIPSSGYINLLVEKKSLSLKEIQSLRQMIQERHGVTLSLVDLIHLCPNLEKLDISDSEITDVELVALFANGKLTNLKELKLYNCSKLTTIPNLNLPQLTTLSIAHCANVSQLGDFQLPSLLTLNLYGCTTLAQLPHFQLPQLKKLNLAYCNGLRSLPEFHLPSLTEIDLFGCICLEKLPNFKETPLLKQIDIRNCFSLKSTPNLKPEIELIDWQIEKNWEHRLFKKFPSSFESFKEWLSKKTFVASNTLKDFQQAMKERYQLSLSLAEVLKLLPNVTELSLSSSDMTAEELTALFKEGDLGKITTLNLYGFNSLPLMETSTFPNLHSLGIHYSNELTTIENLKNLPNLESLDLISCPLLSKLPNFQSFTNLKNIYHVDCFALQQNLLEVNPNIRINTYNSLIERTSLTEKEIQNYREEVKKRYGITLSFADIIYLCPHLKRLELFNSPITDEELASIFCESNLQELEVFHMHRCHNITSLPNLKLPQLKELSCTHCNNLKYIPNLNLQNLTKLDISGCIEITKLPSFHLPNLTRLELCHCKGLTNLPNDMQLPHLTRLDLFGCTELTTLPDLKPFSELVELDLRRASHQLFSKISTNSNVKVLYH